MDSITSATKLPEAAQHASQMSRDAFRKALAQASAAEDTPTFEYDVETNWAGAIGSTVHVTFKAKDSGKALALFDGAAGGSAGGGGVGWGTATLAFAVESIIGWEARFAVESAGIIGGGMFVQLWAMDGRPLGSCYSGGLFLGSNVAGGQGRFKRI